MPERFKLSHRWVVGLLGLMVGLVLGATFLTRSVLGLDSRSTAIAHGGGTTIIQGGTGSPAFVPVITTIAFHATKSGNSVTGSFECLAEAPEAGAGSKGAQFTVNAMYVTGQITGASVHGDTATLTGTANITGLGAGSNVPFTFVVQRGGPGATSVLTVNTLPASPFNEILVQGTFEVLDQD